MDSSPVFLGLLAVIVLVTANAAFVAAELAIVAVRRTRVEQLVAEGNASAKLLRQSIGNIDTTIATIQLGITLAGLALGAIGEPALSGIIEPPVEWTVGSVASEGVTRAVAVAVAFTLVTFLLIVLGELAPKSIALAKPERFALLLAPPVRLLTIVFRPVVWVMNAAGGGVVRLLGVQRMPEDGESLEPEELELVIQASARAGLLSSSEMLMARRALEFSAIQANQIMIPRTEVVGIDVDEPMDDVLRLVEQTGHTRYPVFERNLDNVIGVLTVKDLLPLVRQGQADWRRAIRPAIAIPESVSLEAAVATMRGRQSQVAVLVDEHGGTSGIVTADEILYRLLGRWLGGNRPGAEAVRPLSTGNYLLSGLALIADVEEAIGIELADENYETVGGFLMARLGRIPRPGDQVALPGYRFRVLSMDGRRVDRVMVRREGDKVVSDADAERLMRG